MSSSSSSTPLLASLLQLSASSPTTWAPSHLSSLIASLTSDAASRHSFSQALLSTPRLLANLVTAVKTTVHQDADYWMQLAQLRAPPRDAEDEGATRIASSVIDVDVERRLDVAKKAARMLTNGVAGQSEAQAVVFHRLDDVRWALWRLTSFHLAQIKELAPLTRILSQLLSNLITSNPELQQRLFDSLGMPSAGQAVAGEKGKGMEDETGREAELICRLVASEDAGTRMGAQMMLLNAVAHSTSRAEALAQTPSGALILSTMLQKVDDLVAHEESEAQREVESVEFDSGIGSLLGERIVERGESGARDEALGMSPVIVQRLFSLGLFGPVLHSLAPKPSAATTVHGAEPPRLVSTSQVVLLKFLDADLHGVSPCVGGNVDKESAAHKAGLLVLVDIFSHLAKGLIELLRGQEASQRSAAPAADVGDEVEGGNKGLEEKVKEEATVDAFVAFVLVLQCLVWAVVRAEQDGGASERTAQRERDLDQMARDVNLRFRERERQGVEDVVELLRLVSDLFPSTSPFGPSVTATPSATATRSSDSSPSSGDTPPRPRTAPVHHVLSSTGLAHAQENPTLHAPTLHIKRSLVQLLAALAYLPPRGSAAVRQLSKEEYSERRKRARDTQDRVRECQGVVQVLNALRLDEGNPYIREHAVFAMRNLLSDNAENQAIVASLRPL